MITCAIIGFTIATGLNALGFGLKSLAFCRAMTGFSVAVVMGGRLSGKLAGNLGPRHVLTLGILSAAVALFVLAFFYETTNHELFFTSPASSQ